MPGRGQSAVSPVVSSSPSHNSTADHVLQQPNSPGGRGDAQGPPLSSTIAGGVQLPSWSSSSAQDSLPAVTPLASPLSGPYSPRPFKDASLSASAKGLRLLLPGLVLPSAVSRNSDSDEDDEDDGDNEDSEDRSSFFSDHETLLSISKSPTFPKPASFDFTDFLADRRLSVASPNSRYQSSYNGPQNTPSSIRLAAARRHSALVSAAASSTESDDRLQSSSSSISARRSPVNTTTIGRTSRSPSSSDFREDLKLSVSSPAVIVAESEAQVKQDGLAGPQKAATSAALPPSPAILPSSPIASIIPANISTDRSSDINTTMLITTPLPVTTVTVIPDADDYTSTVRNPLPLDTPTLSTTTLLEPEEKALAATSAAALARPDLQLPLSKLPSQVSPRHLSRRASRKCDGFASPTSSTARSHRRDSSASSSSTTFSALSRRSSRAASMRGGMMMMDEDGDDAVMPDPRARLWLELVAGIFYQQLLLLTMQRQGRQLDINCYLDIAALKSFWLQELQRERRKKLANRIKKCMVVVRAFQNYKGKLSRRRFLSSCTKLKAFFNLRVKGRVVAIKRNAVASLLTFLEEIKLQKFYIRHMIRRLLNNVRKCQRFWRDYQVCTSARLTALTIYFERVEAIYHTRVRELIEVATQVESDAIHMQLPSPLAKGNLNVLLPMLLTSASASSPKAGGGGGGGGGGGPTVSGRESSCASSSPRPDDTDYRPTTPASLPTTTATTPSSLPLSPTSRQPFSLVGGSNNSWRVNGAQSSNNISGLGQQQQQGAGSTTTTAPGGRRFAVVSPTSQHQRTRSASVMTDTGASSPIHATTTTTTTLAHQSQSPTGGRRPTAVSVVVAPLASPTAATSPLNPMLASSTSPAANNMMSSSSSTASPTPSVVHFSTNSFAAYSSTGVRIRIHADIVADLMPLGAGGSINDKHFALRMVQVNRETALHKLAGRLVDPTTRSTMVQVFLARRRKAYREDISELVSSRMTETVQVPLSLPRLTIEDAYAFIHGHMNSHVTQALSSPLSKMTLKRLVPIFRLYSKTSDQDIYYLLKEGIAYGTPVGTKAPEQHQATKSPMASPSSTASVSTSGAKRWVEEVVPGR